MLEEIIRLREQGVSFRKIAKELDMTVGKVQYQWVKYQKTVTVGQPDAGFDKSSATPKRVGRVRAKKQRPVLKSHPSAELIMTFSSFTRIYCYWMIPENWLKHTSEQLSVSGEDHPFVLRLYDVTSIAFDGHNQHSHMDTYVPAKENGWFVSGLRENRSYCMDIGWKLEDGTFLAFTRSNVIHTPRTEETQEHHRLQDLHDFEAGRIRTPNWVEHVSTYSYYVKEVKS
ncbi:DUF4912 domain-containing protein [Rossellomorea marisflavi]|uniref:DUF4912 domain-containing protein n=1 Tax=Rossellomorea marisflavi TaxID=189381 RepID=UPI001EE30EE8|nr:DUF4912 domain-containing protein [Rossellomorea marisflavi]UKS64038.1 DUF4912 domain-containing protein [Rossellomorea marisflavi]